MDTPSTLGGDSSVALQKWLYQITIPSTEHESSCFTNSRTLGFDRHFHICSYDRYETDLLLFLIFYLFLHFLLFLQWSYITCDHILLTYIFKKSLAPWINLSGLWLLFYSLSSQYLCVYQQFCKCSHVFLCVYLVLKPERTRRKWQPFLFCNYELLPSP